MSVPFVSVPEIPEILMLNIGGLYGRGVFRPDEYTEYFVNVSAAGQIPTRIGSVGIYGEGSAAPRKDPVTGERGSWNPLSDDPNRVLGPKSPSVVGGGFQYGYSKGAGGGVSAQLQHYWKLKCISLK